MSFVLGAKPGDHKALFAWVDELESAPAAPGSKPGVERWETKDADGVGRRFRRSNGAPLNDAHADLEVNFLEYRERGPNGRTRHFSWVTDLRMDRWNAMELMRAGRARWRIENETFNTLKNQGCEFEHNFGHGEKHLATVFACLMMLAFGIDQLQKARCPLFRAALARKGRAKYFWEDFRSMFTTFRLPDWDTFYRALAFGHEAPPCRCRSTPPEPTAGPNRARTSLASSGNPTSPPRASGQAGGRSRPFPRKITPQLGSPTKHVVSGSRCSSHTVYSNTEVSLNEGDFRAGGRVGIWLRRR